jgi:serine/threonine protein kinase
MEDLTGKQFGPYQIVAPLGEGGMAAVYKAYQPGMDRYVALKVLPHQLANNLQFAGRFEQEAKVLAKLQHPHILPVFDYGQADGYTYIVMPFIPSGDLTDLLQGQPLPLPQIRRIISQIGDALDYAHQAGLIHRDVKPSNVLLDERGNCLLTDFGIAKIVESSGKLTVTGGIIGTPAYMSPEQGAGEKLDNRSDIYALGIMLYEMAVGRVPYRAETPMAVIIKHMQDPLPMPRQVNPALPEAVERVILKSLAKQPTDRYTTAAEMVQALQVAIPETLTGQSVPVEAASTLSAGPADLTATSAAVKTTSPTKPSRPIWLWLGGAILALALLVGAGVILSSALSNQDEPVGQPTVVPTQLAGVIPTEPITATEPPQSTPTEAATAQPEVAATEPVEAGSAEPTAETPPFPEVTAEVSEITEVSPILYDDFDDSTYDGSFNSMLWLPNSDEGCEVKQEDGALVFTIPAQPQDTSCGLLVAVPETVSFAALGAIAANLQITHDLTGQAVNQGLILTAAEIPEWYTFCGLDVRPEGVQAYFEVAGQSVDISQGVAAAYDQWHTFRLEADPATLTLTCYVDGTMIGSVIPTDAKALRQAQIQRGLDSYRQAESSATVYADEVILDLGILASAAAGEPEPQLEVDSTVYDNFDDPAFDGNFNPTQWAFFSDTENGGQAVQAAGELELERYDQAAGAIGLEAVAYNQSLQAPTFFAADLMLTGPQNGHVYLAVGPEWLSKEYADCIFGHTDETGAIDCNYYYVNEDSLAYEMSDYPVEYNTWHTVKIEVDPTTMTFTFYIDDELIDTFTSARTKTIKNVNFTFNIGLWGESDEPLTGYVDNVRVGNP